MILNFILTQTKDSILNLTKQMQMILYINKNNVLNKKEQLFWLNLKKNVKKMYRYYSNVMIHQNTGKKSKDSIWLLM